MQNQSPVPGPSSRPDDDVRTIRCRRCTQSFSNRRELYLHGMQEHYQTGSGVLQSRPWNRGEAPWELDLDERLKTVYEANAPIILENNQESSTTSSYNVPLTNDFSIPQLMEHAERIYDRQGHAFRLNLEFGLILRHTETGEYRYFRPYANESLFERPIYISRRKDLNRLRLRLQRFNVSEYILRQRPDTKWKPYLVTNVRVILYHLNYPLGNCEHLPEYITTSKSIVALHKDRNGRHYKDHLCAFRCLAVHRGHHKEKLESHTKTLYQKWVQFNKTKQVDLPIDPQRYDGLALDQMSYFEKCFQINVNIFHLRDDGVTFTVYKSRCRFKEIMHFNQCDHHLSYISNLEAYSKKYQCDTCHRHFQHMNNMKRHQLKCTGQTRYRFPGGFYSTPKTIFEKLEEHGINVPLEDRLCKWFIVYDFEAMLIPIKESNSEKLTWTQRHEPISVSLCSNVEGYTEPHCIVDPDVETLVGKMVHYMNKIADKTMEMAQQKFSDVFDQIGKDIANPLQALFDDYDDDEYKLGVSLDDGELQDVNEKEKNIYQKLKDELDDYCRETIVLGFNSAKYDMNLIKSYLSKSLNMHTTGKKFTVKRNNSYACLANGTFKFWT